LNEETENLNLLLDLPLEWQDWVPIGPLKQIKHAISRSGTGLDEKIID
jgi:hypothetical protein